MIHKYKLNDYNIVIDVNSGAIHVVDDISFDILGHISENMEKEMPEIINKTYSNKYSKEELEESYKELYNLYEAGSLFTPDVYEETAEKVTLNLPIKSMCINVAHDCNLRCEYCFAEKGDFGGARKLMSEDTARKAIDFLIKNSGTRHNLDVDFFGGEPLMNFDVVKGAISYARSIEKKYNKNFRFTITTNGLLLTDEIIEYINKEMSNLVLSLDGRREVNDRFRLTKSNKGSYDVILPRIKKAVESRGDKEYYVRGTYTRYNLDFWEDIKYLYDLGFKNISLEPVVSDSRLDYSIKYEDIGRICEEYERVAKEIIDLKEKGSEINFCHFMIDFEHSPCLIRRLRSCGCGNEYVAVTPEGDIYPCHQFVGNNSWKMGNINDKSFNREMKQKFSQSTVYRKKECKTCWAKFYCGGGCNANNLSYCGDIMKVHKLSCKMQKKRLECAIMVKAATS